MRNPLPFSIHEAKVRVCRWRNAGNILPTSHPAEVDSMKYFAAIALFAFAFFPAPGAQDKSISADEIQIRQLERAWNQAEMKQETGAVDNLMADSLVYTDYD